MQDIEILYKFKKISHEYTPSGQSLRFTHGFWLGFSVGFFLSGGKMKNNELILEFDKWVVTKYGDPNTTRGWYDTIVRNAKNSIEACNLFYQLLDEFMARHHPKTLNSISRKIKTFKTFKLSQKFDISKKRFHELNIIQWLYRAKHNKVVYLHDEESLERLYAFQCGFQDGCRIQGFDVSKRMVMREFANWLISTLGLSSNSKHKDWYHTMMQKTEDGRIAFGYFFELLGDFLHSTHPKLYETRFVPMPIITSSQPYKPTIASRVPAKE